MHIGHEKRGRRCERAFLVRDVGLSLNTGAQRALSGFIFFLFFYFFDLPVFFLLLVFEMEKQCCGFCGGI